MHLSADTIYAEEREDDYPYSVGFRDDSADYCVIFSRFSDMTPDKGTINVLVRDQIHTETAALLVKLSRNCCHIQLDKDTAAELLNVREYIIKFDADDNLYERIVQLFHTIFQGLPGLTIVR